jgi:TRAP-type C4-dicarboxylate transport system permease small subunit
VSQQILVRTQTIINAVGKTLGYIGIGVVVAMMLLTVSDVFMRFFLNRPILGSTEITSLMMVVLSFFTLVWCTVLKAHIKVDLIAKYMTPMSQTISESIYFLLGLGLFSLISWQNISESAHARHLDVSSATLGIPVHPFYLVVAIGCGVTALALLVNLIQNIVDLVKR